MIQRTKIKNLAVCMLFACMNMPMLVAQTAQPREKTFVHTDRGTYLTGETVWFNVFCTDAMTNKPSALSKLAYVELMGSGKNAGVHAKVVLSNGTGNGYMNIPSYLPSGNYTLRGWTNWMRNFSGQGAFIGSITLINPNRRPENPKSSSADLPLVGLYPEGGHLVTGIDGLVACHVTDQFGNGISAQGRVLRNGTDTITGFTTTTRGFGKFILRPESGVRYSIVLSTTQGKHATYPLIDADKDGYSLSVERNGGGVAIRATPSANTMKENLTLALLRGAKVVRAWSGRNSGQPMAWNVAMDSLPEGVSRFTLFDQEGRPIAERAFFRRPIQGKLSIQANTDRTEYNNRANVDLQLTTRSNNEAPAATTLSVSVYKVDSLETHPADRLEEWLWLGSELRGWLQDPSYYFSDTATAEATDLLLLTQGWSRFPWQDSAISVMKFAPEFSGHLITGTITRRSDGQPLPGIPTFLSVQGKRFHYSTALSDSAGRVSFDLKKIYGSGSIIVQTGIDSTAHLALDDPWKHGFPEQPTAPLLVDPSLAGTLRKAVLYQRTGQRTPTAGQFYFPDATDSLPFFGQAEKTYLLDDYTRFRTMDEIFREFIPEVQVKRSKGSYELRVDHAPLQEFFSTDPLLLLDGVPYFHTDEVMNFDPTKIRKIDIVNRHYYQGNQDYSGIISMSTYDGDGGGIPLNPNAILVEYEGLQLRREFPAPEYKTPEQLASRQPDFRRLLHWAPGIWTGEKGKAVIKFYTGDDKGRYLIVAQGLSDAGQAGSSITTIEVK